jgi:hypothetical protein
MSAEELETIVAGPDDSGLLIPGAVAPAEQPAASSPAAARARALTSSTALAARRRRPGCRKRCGIRTKRCLEREWRGATVPQLVLLIGSIVLPLMDAGSDWAVTISFYYSDDVAWFKAGLSIQVISGFVSGMFLGMVYSSDLQVPKRYAYPFSLLVGLPGLAPAAWAMTSLYLQDANVGAVGLKYFKIVELIFEALPQSVLQSYVAVAYGRLNPSGDDFDPLLAGSIFISLVGAGATMFGMEVVFREELQLRVTTKYGLVRVLAGASATAALVFWVALLTCGMKGLAAIAMVVVVCGYYGLANETSTRSSDSNRIFEEAAVCDCCGERGPALGAGQWAVCCLGCTLVMTGTMAIMFFSVEHMDNNYANSSMPIGGAGDPQYYDCHDRQSGWYPAVACTVATTILVPLSWLIDPEIGKEGFRGLNWEEQVARDSKTITQGTAFESVYEAKIAEVWAYADVFEDGTLEPREIYRLAQATGDQNSDDVVRDILLRLGKAEGLPDRDYIVSDVKKDEEASKCYWRYVQMCTWMEVEALPRGMVSKSDNPKFKWPNAAGSAAYRCSEEKFVSLALADANSNSEDPGTDSVVGAVFRYLKLPLKRRSRGVLSTICGC